MRSRLTSAAAAATTALTLALAPAAQAAPSILDLGSQLIKGADCNTLRTTLHAIDTTTSGELLTPETTRNQLSRNLRELNPNGQTLSPIQLAATKFAGETADRALKCGIVKQDTLLTGGTGLSSQLGDYLPLLSSTLRQGA